MLETIFMKRTDELNVQKWKRLWMAIKNGSLNFFPAFLQSVTFSFYVI